MKKNIIINLLFLLLISLSDATSAADKTAFDVKMKSIVGTKLAVIKFVKDKLGVGLAESKAIVERCDDGNVVVIKVGLSEDEAASLTKDLNNVGAEAFYE